jgi:hypothetical protein
MTNYYIILVFLCIAIYAITTSLLENIRELRIENSHYDVDLFQESIEIPFNVTNASEDLVNALLERGVLTYDGQYHVAEVVDK